MVIRRCLSSVVGRAMSLFVHSQVSADALLILLLRPTFSPFPFIVNRNERFSFGPDNWFGLRFCRTVHWNSVQVVTKKPTQIRTLPKFQHSR